MPTLPNQKQRQSLLRRYLSGLSFPKLFLLLGGLFALDLVVPDPIPFFDEAVLGILTVMLGMLRKRKKEERAKPEAGRAQSGN